MRTGAPTPHRAGEVSTRPPAPHPAPRAAPPRSAATAPAPPAAHLPGDGPAAVALAAVGAAAVLTLGRVFSDAGWVAPLLVAALAPHLVGWFGRRRGWSAPATVAATLGCLFVVAVWFVAPETTRAGFPTGASVRRLGDLLGDGWLVLRHEVAPVPSTSGVLLLCVAAAGLAAVTADALAFPLRSALGSTTARAEPSVRRATPR